MYLSDLTLCYIFQILAVRSIAIHLLSVLTKKQEHQYVNVHKNLHVQTHNQRCVAVMENLTRILV